MTLGVMTKPSNMGNVSFFGPNYPEWATDTEMKKIERRTNKKRTRLQVLEAMENHKEKPLPICMSCEKTCIQRQVVGLAKFECYVRGR